MNLEGLVRNISLKLFIAFAAVLFAVEVSTGQAPATVVAPRSDVIDSCRLICDIRHLSSDEMEGRSADRPSINKARDYIEQRYRESGLEPMNRSFRQEFRITQPRTEETLLGINFVGQIKGKVKADRYIIITAHYDHLGIRNGEIYNGADDNASGTAALFAIAKFFSTNKPDHSLMFVALDAEERGLQGARHFVANLPVPKESILLNVNMDMISRNDKNELYAAGTYHYPQFKQALEAVQKTASVKLLLGHDRPELGQGDWTNQSDHAAFHREKIPFIYLGVEDHKDYHRPTDTFENIQPDFYVKAVETVIEAVRMFDKATE
jgi:Zn-dependent M28 family amino/carboxypeptidase